MLWAIDVGNTHTVVGVHDGSHWAAVWRLATLSRTEDETAALLAQLGSMVGISLKGDQVVVASVVPSQDEVWSLLAAKWLDLEAWFLRKGSDVGLEVTYDPPHAVGADRIANALAAIKLFGAPVVVVDFGTATTFDVVDSGGRYVGGAIVPGVATSVEALSRGTSKLPPVSLEAPSHAIGRNTVQAIQSGVMFGYAGAIDSLAAKIQAELGGGAKFVATGGLAGRFHGLCQCLDVVEPLLTLDGLREAARVRHLP
jgi:type III pantothenate kinase